DLLHATKIDDPSLDGWAQVGEHESSPGFGASPWPGISFIEPAVIWWASGAPLIPISLSRVTMKCRAALRVVESTSTTMSSIIQAEYCRVPWPLIREPWGIVHVLTLATSAIEPVSTIDTDDGTITPCRLKLTKYRKFPSGVTSIVAANR